MITPPLSGKLPCCRLDVVLIQYYAKPPLHYHTPIMTPRCVARLIGSSHRAGLHDVIVLNERRPHRVLASSIDQDQTYRVHRFFDMGATA